MGAGVSQEGCESGGGSHSRDEAQQSSCRRGDETGESGGAVQAGFVILTEMALW